MPIDPTRIAADIDAIAAFSESPATVGHSRPTFSEPWRQARDYVIAQASAAWCKHRLDWAGNVFIRPESLGWEEKVWLSGSHIDSVPTGGKYDGVMGIVVPLEVLRGGPVPLELVIWAEEEGTTFGLGMIGSRLAVGDATADSVARFKNRDGQTFAEAGRPFGVTPARAKPFDTARYRGLVEVHAEQGPAMWETGVPVAVVTAIAGRKQYKVKLIGQPNHAGSTPMSYRRDALVAAAHVVAGVQNLANDLGGGTVATVGRLDVEPNAINVIPGIVRLTVDLRSPDDVKLQDGHARLNDLVMRSGVEFNCFETEDQPVMPMNADLCARLTAMVGHTTTSGALHDAAILAPLLPTAMLFVASKDGISHNPAEFSRIEDIAAAADVLDRLVRE
jgi:hydantoinase/carbamoylase family amidase